MPELPEVQTVVDTLKPNIIDKKIEAVEVIEEKLVEKPRLEEFKDLLVGQIITNVKRRGKYIIIELDNSYYLVSHLRMTGRFSYVDDGQEIGDYDYILFKFSDNEELRLGSKRKFTRTYLVDDLADAGSLTDLGPEPLSEEFTLDMFKELIAPRRGRMKPLLLNQKFIAGLGSIYVDESLFISGIHPMRTADTLTEEEITKLHGAIRQVLAEGIEHRGTTKWDYVDASGQAGSYQDELRVYDREEEECFECGTKIQRTKVGGRSAYFCPQCQPLEE
ncbi:bifunctional DNA-formamidopyrimidine glycosylase/DNA-(apurinic or apyrimidinic site) lyase [Halanaerobacter jeridensis]|uniref:Formamidopyrimidine-DNA glycosylase n=1 Tax=Halanaerobacter jeridensis TaxID=706427 RepID=A0A938XWT0_9FIRM|nr:bifunctional DNA-formamidopyrimidine glycosylase/DNA-(apurinic or apyrimidinic site) lyase [Halanaerobacter jeridensis]MBM7557087.1 formamidopyrimidine-DNA glycosylase [Halanaerobacter jeridensis]